MWTALVERWRNWREGEPNGEMEGEKGMLKCVGQNLI